MWARSLFGSPGSCVCISQWAPQMTKTHPRTRAHNLWSVSVSFFPVRVGKFRWRQILIPSCSVLRCRKKRMGINNNKKTSFFFSSPSFQWMECTDTSSLHTRHQRLGGPAVGSTEFSCPAGCCERCVRRCMQDGSSCTKVSVGPVERKVVASRGMPAWDPFLVVLGV